MNKLRLVLLFVIGATQLYSQNINEPQDTIEVEVEYSDYLKGEIVKGQMVRIMSGDVRLRQGNAILTCDSASMIGNEVKAYGEVVIEEDTVKIFADSLFYDGNNRKARLMGDVILTDSKSDLFTSVLYYDMETKVGTYNTGAVIKNKDTRLFSKKGYYYVDLDEAYFKDSVVVADPEFSLKTDTLKINTETNITYFLGATNILNKDGSQIFCTDGFYDPQNKYAEFKNQPRFKTEDGLGNSDKIIYKGDVNEIILDGNAFFKDKSQTVNAPKIFYNTESKKFVTEGGTKIQDEGRTIVAQNSSYDEPTETVMFSGQVTFSDSSQILDTDTLYYQREQRLGKAMGSVVWRDTTQDIMIECDTLFFNDSTEYIKAIGRPLMSTLVEDDSLYMAADTLFSYPLDTLNKDSSRVFVADKNVRLFKSNLQAICDSLVYNIADSTFEFFKNPIIWSDTSQFMADTVSVLMKDEQIHRIFLTNNAFIINSPDEIFFNQVKGKSMTAYFEEGEIRRMRVFGNGESVYYAVDGDEYVAVNKTVCSEMMLYFGNNNVDDIRFYTKPTATLYPMNQVDHNTLLLKGYRWEKAKRPKSKADLR